MNLAEAADAADRARALLIRGEEILAKQCDDLEDRNKDLAGAVRVLAEAIRDIGDIAEDNVDLDSHAWNSVYHICRTAGGIQAAMRADG